MARVEIVVYRFTGRQFFFEVPQKWCEECDLTIRLVREVLRELDLEHDRRVRLTIKPWMANVLESLASGGWHPPVVTINDQTFSQGVVPDRAKLKNLLRRLLSLPLTPSSSSISR